MYVVRIDILEEATHYAFPVVRHEFRGRTKDEAWHYHDAHKQADSFLRGCEDKGVFQGSVRCRARVSEGWER